MESKKKKNTNQKPKCKVFQEKDKMIHRQL